MTDITRPVLERFEEKFIQDNPKKCWIWQASKNSHGYGRFSPKTGSNKYAHRISWEFYRGPIPTGTHVLHRCDVPTCVNPNHLFLGTHQDNMDDKVAKGRHATGKNCGTRKLNETQVHEIRANNESTGALAKQYGVGSLTIWQIRTRQTWKWLEEKSDD